jgi:hypothetical protein
VRAAALLISLGVLALELAGWVAWTGASRLGLVLVPWIVVAGVPRAQGAPAARRGPDRRGAWPELTPLLALPVVAVAAAVDRAQIGAWAPAAAATGLAVVALLAQGAARGEGWYAALWLLVAAVPAGLATAYALSVEGATFVAADAAPAGLGAWIAATPWVWAGRAVAAGAAGSAAGGGVGPLACAALLAAVGVAEGARRRRGAPR